MLEVLEPDFSLITPLPFCSELCNVLLVVVPVGAADVRLIAIAAMIAAAL